MVPESERSACRFDVLLKANKLASYTINICSNENVFLPQYKTSITDDLIKTAKDIYINCYAANEYKPNRSLPEIKSRLSLQTHALIECNKLLALIQIAKPIFHLSSKRIEYWSKLVFDTRALISAWHYSDCNRC